MKPIDPKEELLQALAVSLLRDVFAAATLVGMYANGFEKDTPSAMAESAFFVSDEMLRRSHTPALIDKMKNL